ncbi:MAG: DUF6507 family protein [Dermatophilaceae bacterium]
MASWDVDAAGAGRVIGAAADRAAGFLADVAGVDSAAGGVVGVLPTSPLVVRQLVVFGEEVASPGVSAVAGYTHSAVRGGSDAVMAYVAGDVEMAAQSQHASGAAVYPLDTPGAGGRGGGAGSGGRETGGGAW